VKEGLKTLKEEIVELKLTHSRKYGDERFLVRMATLVVIIVIVKFI